MTDKMHPTFKTETKQTLYWFFKEKKNDSVNKVDKRDPNFPDHYITTKETTL